MNNRSFTDLLEEAKTGGAYWVDKVSLEFTEDLCERMDRQGMSRADLARQIGVSRGYITKVLRGSGNVTLETMVKLARAVGGELEVRLHEPVDNRQWSADPKPAKEPKRLLGGFTKTGLQKPMAGGRRDTPIAA
jgi:transcriptional regulator with XRE-family HTH domain